MVGVNRNEKGSPAISMACSVLAWIGHKLFSWFVQVLSGAFRFTCESGVMLRPCNVEGAVTHDWNEIRRQRFSPSRPDEWPKDVHAISMAGLALLGVHKETGTLYWDGKEIVVRRTFRLGTFERWVASIAAFGTLGTFLVNLVRLLMGG